MSVQGGRARVSSGDIAGSLQLWLLSSRCCHHAIPGLWVTRNGAAFPDWDPFLGNLGRDMLTCDRIENGAVRALYMYICVHPILILLLLLLHYWGRSAIKHLSCCLTQFLVISHTHTPADVTICGCTCPPQDKDLKPP